MLNGRDTKVLVDANVLFSRTLRDWLALLFLEQKYELFTVLWTEDIMAELLYHLRKRYPMVGEQQVGGVRRTLAATFENGLVTGYTIDPSVSYPDIGDAHVHCAALHAGADVLLTTNTKDFVGIDTLPYSVTTPDDFFTAMDDVAPQIVRAVTAKQVAYFINVRGQPTGFSLPAKLTQAGAPDFADRIRAHIHALDIRQLQGSLALHE